MNSDPLLYAPSHGQHRHRYPEPGGLFEPQAPPPPSRPPKVFEPVFLQIDILGEVLALKAPKKIFGLLRGYSLFYPTCLHSKYSEFCGEFQNG